MARRKRYKRMGKGESMYKHVKQRSKERFHLQVTPTIFQRMIDAVQDITVNTFLFKQSASRRMHSITIKDLYNNDVNMVVVYDPKRKSIHTVLTKEQANERHREISARMGE